MSDQQTLSGQHALVTGGGTGIGAAVARELDGLGASVTVVGRRAGPLDQVADSLQRGFAVTADVTSRETIDAAFAAARERFGTVGILVNNAGIAESAPVQRTSLEMWRRHLDINLTGSFLCMQAYLAEPPASGRIVNVASIAGVQGAAYIAAYCASKHGLVGLTRAAAAELFPRNITVNAVCPAYTETEMVTRAVETIVAKTGRSPDEARAQIEQPQGRLVKPEEVAATVAWLCQPSSAAINGQAIVVAGGGAV